MAVGIFLDLEKCKGQRNWKRSKENQSEPGMKFRTIFHKHLIQVKFVYYFELNWVHQAAEMVQDEFLINQNNSATKIEEENIYYKFIQLRHRDR